MSHSAHNPEEFDAVVIGSGFGGAVAAHQLATVEGGLKRILVLERGMPYPPGSFSRTPWEWRDNVWAPPVERYGLFEILSFPRVTAVLASGLGGGSLIYANVLLEKPADTFKADASNGWRAWPVSHSDLAAGYQAVLKKLRPVSLPRHGPDVPKRGAFQRAVGSLGLEPEDAPLAISFAAGHGAPPEPGMPLLTESGQVDRDNLHDRPRRTCTYTGQCDFGCNEGAKNTLDFNYLSEFTRTYGGEIRTCCEAVRIAGPRGRDGGYDVRYRQFAAAKATVRKRAEQEGHMTDRDLLDPCDANEVVVRGKIVVLAAGTFGSTKLLLRSQSTLPRLSPQLGRRFSSNGDILKFARHCRGTGENWRPLAPSRGPVITSYAVDQADGHDLWLEDGGYPRGMEMMWQATGLPRNLWRMRRSGWRWMRRQLLGSVGPDLIQAVGHAHASGAMMPLLGMGRDMPGGRIGLHGDLLTLDWNPDGASDGYFRTLERRIAEITAELGGHVAGRGLARNLVPGRGLTAHSLGGCGMATNPEHGVVDAYGRVFGCPGLYVADGSIMPGPIGPNPSLTIAAMAYRIGKEAAIAARSAGGSGRLTRAPTARGDSPERRAIGGQGGT